MVTIGADPHKRSHTLVAVDERGRKLAERTASATPAGHLALLHWARERFPERHWALEDCRHLSRGFERDLLAAGETVVRVPPKLMAGQRRSGRDYLEKRMAVGDTKTEAIRALRRRLCDVVFRCLRDDEAHHAKATRQAHLAPAA